MNYNSYTLCDNIRVIELAAELPNENATMDLAIFIQLAISEHLQDENDCFLELGTIAEIRLCPKYGEVELTTSSGAAVMNNYLFYGIKDWDLPKLIHISDKFAERIVLDIHRSPSDDDGKQYYADFGEC